MERAVKTVTINGLHFSFINWFEFAAIYKDVFILKEYCFRTDNPTPYILDCGSHIGVSVLYFAHMYPGATVHAFEPNESSYRLLCKNISDNHIRRVQTHREAVAKKRGTVHFYTPKNVHDYSWGNTVLPGRFKSGTFQDTKVTAVPLSAYITKTVDFLKLDVEGSELDVLTEIRPKLRFVREMVLELHTWGRNKTDMYDRVVALLDGVMKIESLRKVGSIASSKIFRSSLHSARHDLFLIRASRI